MPSWKVHRYWARRLGLKDEVSEKVDRIIDFGKFGHDWIKGNIGRFTFAVGLFYRDLGIDGIKAMILHGMLDYADGLLKMGFSRYQVLWRVVAWVKFAGAKHIIRYIAGLPIEERLKEVIKRDFGYYDLYLRMDLKDFIEDAEIESVVDEVKKIVKELIEFFVKNSNEIFDSLRDKNETNRSKNRSST